MNYKLIALDIDGTLTNSKREISPRTRYSLIEAQQKGKRVILASGRHPFGIKPIAEELMLERYGGYVVAFNGAKIISCETGETILKKLFPREYIPDIVGVIKDSKLTINTFDKNKIIAGGRINDYSYIERDVIKLDMTFVDNFISAVRFDIYKILLSGEPDEIDKYEKIIKNRYDGLLDVYKSAPYFLELMPFGVSKGCVLHSLLQSIGGNREELIAFGDNYNDITMIGYAGFGVAMGNAEDDLKRAADYICESNDEDGVAKTLQKFVLNEAGTGGYY